MIYLGTTSQEFYRDNGQLTRIDLSSRYSLVCRFHFRLNSCFFLCKGVSQSHAPLSVFHTFPMLVFLVGSPCSNPESPRGEGGQRIHKKHWKGIHGVCNLPKKKGPGVLLWVGRNWWWSRFPPNPTHPFGWVGWNWCSRPSQPAVGCSHHKKNTALGALSTLNRKAKRKSLPKPIPCLGIHRSCSGWATKNGIPVQGKIGIFRNFAWLCRSVWGALTLLQILVQLPNAMLLYSYLIVTSVNSYCLYKLNLLPAPHQGPPHLHLHCPCQAIHLP